MPLWAFLLCFFVAALWAISPIMTARGRANASCTVNEINPVRSLSFFISSLAIALIANSGDLNFVTSLRALGALFATVTISYIIGDILCFSAIKEIGVSLAIPISNTYPVMTPFFALLLLGEDITFRIMFGISFVVAGIALLNFGGKNKLSFDFKNTSSLPMLKGVSLALGASLAWAFSAPFMKMAITYSEMGPIDIAFNKSLVFFIVAWAYRFYKVKFSPLKTQPIMSLPLKTLGYFSGAAFIGLCLGSIFQALCLKTISVNIVTAITATSPFIAALFGHFVLKDLLTKFQWVGVALIIGGSIFVAL
ncbi:MAG: DMT family transporter [Synergistaceae bacterium]